MTTIRIKSTNQPLPLALPSNCLKILHYLISLPDNSELDNEHMRLTLCITEHGRKSSIIKLQAFGYLQIQRLSSGYNIWHVYDTPQPIKPKVKKEGGK